MLNVSDNAIYNRAKELLSDYRRSCGGTFKGRFIQIFFALKFYQNELPSMYSGRYVESGVLQTLLDDLYCKNSRPANNCVLSLFENNYLARTGIVPPGRNYAANIWRNNFNLQKGIGCYASSTDLSSTTFLNESRGSCRYLESSDGTLNGATCSLCSTGATYRSEDHRKWLQINSSGGGYAVVDMLNTSNFSPYVCTDGQKIPAIPVIICLYYDSNPSLLIGTRNEVTIEVFKNDFNFSHEEFQIYFDDNFDNQFNEALLTEFPGLSFSQSERIALRPSRTIQAATEEEAIPINPILSGLSTTPPMTHSGWDAEQFVANSLIQKSWEVHDVSRQKMGFDLLCKKGRNTVYIEVKSSLGRCSPNLTLREWQQARSKGNNYVMAIIENFNAEGENVIYFVRNPALITGVTETVTTSYIIPRSGWISRVIDIDSI